MPRPIARVYQTFEDATITSSEPRLKAVVVGPHKYVREYPTNRGTILSTSEIGELTEQQMVTTGASPTISAASVTTYPDNIAGAVIQDASVKVYAEGWIEVTSENDAGGTFQNNTLTDSGADFSKVVAGDRLVLTPTGYQVLEDLGKDFIALGVIPGTDYILYSGDVYSIAAVLSEHRLLTLPTLVGSATAGFFAGTDAGYTATYAIGDNSPAYDNVTTSTAGKRRTWREVKLFEDASADFSTAGVTAGHYLKIGSDVHRIESVINATQLTVSSTLAGSPQNKGEFATNDASANIAYSIGTAAGAFKNILDYSLSGTGQRLETLSAIRRVFSVTSATVLTTVQYLPFSGVAGATPIYVRAEHEITNSNIPSGSDGWEITGITVNSTTKEITIPSNRTVTYAAGSRKVVAAKLYIQYTSLRQDYTGEIYAANPNALDADLGEDRTENVLRRAVGIAVANAGSAKIYFCAVPTDDLTGHTAVMAKLANDRAVYYIAPMTKSVSILAAYNSHAENLSTATKGKRRIIICQPADLPSEKELTSSVSDATCESSTVLFSPTADFSAAGVIPGDTVVLSSPTTNEYTVNSVTSGNRLSITGTFTGPETSAVGAVAFTIVRALDTEGQVEELKTIPESYNSKRFITIWPDKCDVGTDVDEPGYYLAAAIAGQCAGIPSHRMTTKLSVAGISKIHNSNKYFDDDQIDALVDAGWYMIEQESTSAAPFTSQQHTSVGSRGSVEDKYLSHVKNFDYVAAEFQTIVNAYPGDWNVIDDLYTSLEDSLTQKATNLMLAKRPKIGAPLVGFSSLRAQPSETQSDKVEAYMKVRLPKVLNELDLYLQSV